VRKGSMWFKRVNGTFVLDAPAPPAVREKTRREQARAVLTDAARTQIKLKAEEICTYCRRQGTFWEDADGEPWHMDHVIPLERGGSIGLDNVALSCRACNMDKGNQTPSEWRPGV